MTNEITLDLSDDKYADQYADAVVTVADMLLELADVSTMSATEVEQTQAAMEEVAVGILAELDLTITGVNADGTVTAILRPKGLVS